MQDNEIIKGLECCTDKRVGACLDCPYKDTSDGDIYCFDVVKLDAISLIKRLTEELNAAKAAAKQKETRKENT